MIGLLRGGRLLSGRQAYIPVYGTEIDAEWQTLSAAGGRQAYIPVYGTESTATASLRSAS